ncbi:hypothetical protein [Streptomyces sp. UG1]|uniref:hypothetical protein n=1 Tax=Streptomyces sp. UG1 TaxID=3417652 RepID=UPI003CFB419C
MIPGAALAVVLAAVEDAQREHDGPEATVVRIVADLRAEGWTLAPLNQAKQHSA